jgi:hypothetical protein
MSFLAPEALRRGDLIRSKRAYLEKLARYLKLHFESSWSQRHLANLVYWRITRSWRNRH